MNHQFRRHDDVPLFAKDRNDDRDNTELRTDIPKWVMGAIDAQCINTGSSCSRKAVVNAILEEWALKKIHDAKVFVRLAEGNPMPSELSGASHG